jgi:hypothetical protein
LSGVPPNGKTRTGQDRFRTDRRPFKALLQSHPDPMTADKVADLRNKFRDAFTGWLEIEEAA